MASTANTFGTFLQTFDTLEKQSTPSSTRPDAKSLIDVIGSLSRSGDSAPVKDLLEHSALPKDVMLSLVIEGQNQGLMNITENEGQPTVNLTQLGKVFIP